MRTNTDNAASPRLRLPQTRPDSPGPDVLQRLGSDTATKHSSVAPVDVKDKRFVMPIPLLDFFAEY
jgi:hypothetical protein